MPNMIARGARHEYGLDLIFYPSASETIRIGDANLKQQQQLTNSMQHRKFGIKRSFHCEDLSSIEHRSDHRVAADDNDNDEALGDSSSRKRTKRQRTMSTGSSSSSSTSDFGEEGEVLPIPSPWAQFDSSSATARLISPTTSHVAITITTTSTAMTTTQPKQQQQQHASAPSLGLPCIPSLRRSRPRSESYGGENCPATSALERFMLRPCERPPSHDPEEEDDGLSPPPSEDGSRDCGDQERELFCSWPKFDERQDLDAFPGQRASNGASPSCVSVQNSPGRGSCMPPSHHRAPRPFSLLSELSSCEQLLPISNETVPTVNHITQALSRM